MVLRLSANFDQTKRAVGVDSGAGEHLEEARLADVVRAGAGYEQPAGTEHLEGAKIEFLVAAESGIEVALRFGESGRVENDSVVVMVGGGVVLEQVEGVRLDPFDIVALPKLRIEGCVLVGDFQRGTGAVDCGDLRATRREGKGKAALVTEDVQSFSLGVLSGGGIVFALVKESSSLLAFEGVVAELHGVHGEGGARFFALQESGRARRKSLQSAYAGVDALNDGCRVQPGGELAEDRLADGVGVHGLGEDLQREDVAVAVDDQAREEIGFAEDDAVALGVVHQRLAIGDGLGDALAKQGWKISHWIVRDHADRDLRGARVKSGA